MRFLAAAVLLAFAPLLAGCLSDQQVQTLVGDGCQLGASIYSKVQNPGPKTTADYKIAETACDVVTSPAFTKAIADLRADIAAGAPE